MTSNLERYKKDIDVLIEKGDNLLWALYHEQDPDHVGAQLDEALGKKAPDFIKSLPDFDSSYQAWYSEAKAMIRQLLPDRIEDFARHYEKPKSRKEITIENYTLEDCSRTYCKLRPRNLEGKSGGARCRDPAPKATDCDGEIRQISF
ncbi:hypothetical protein [Granulicella pectinivorans]|uniref:hypothetical protein n=1 Tax=Granulicella pectinivorans TaxID=474950 RepID=UPI001C31273D|nr:hypothetical protein [Granulicella pectinivorans]